jgi:hypothetical protein
MHCRSSCSWSRSCTLTESLSLQHGRPPQGRRQEAQHKAAGQGRAGQARDAAATRRVPYGSLSTRPRTGRFRVIFTLRRNRLRTHSHDHTGWGGHTDCAAPPPPPPPAPTHTTHPLAAHHGESFHKAHVPGGNVGLALGSDNDARILVVEPTGSHHHMSAVRVISDWYTASLLEGHTSVPCRSPRDTLSTLYLSSASRMNAASFSTSRIKSASLWMSVIRSM